jgi:hypothetical protein
MLRTTLSLLVLLGSLHVSSAHAQVTLNNAALPNPYSSLNTVNGYQPSLVASEQSAEAIYRLLPTSIFKGTSGCYQRAHVWANQLNNQYGLKSMKVFLFFSDRYRREFSYGWTFHVAPLIPVKKADGTIEEMVFDPTFTSAPSWASPRDVSLYDNKPVSIHEWTRYFMYPDVECKVVSSYHEYFDNQDRYYCFIMKTPMYNYSPTDFDGDIAGSTGSRGSDWFNASTGVRNGFRQGDVDNMVKGLIGN